MSDFKFEGRIDELDLGRVIEDAQKFMVFDNAEKTFSKDVLRIQHSSCTQPHLTLVDLPGLFISGNKNQSVSDCEWVKTLVTSYMKQQRSIILAVISAKSEFVLQQVIQRALEVDPKGNRTIGLITKPDTLDAGSVSDQSYLDLIKNEDVFLRLGWHVVKNRDFEMRESTKEQRNASEKDFFSKGVWASLCPSQLGVDATKGKLSKVLHDLNLAQLPGVILEAEASMSLSSSELTQLGHQRDNAHDQQQYLLRVSQDFARLVKAAAEGDYPSDHEFFEVSGS